MTHPQRHDSQSLLVSLVNTRYVPTGDDVLVDSRAQPWLAEHGSAGPRCTEASLDRLRLVREGLRELLLANNAEPVGLDALQAARTALRGVVMTVDLGDTVEAPQLTAPADADAAQEMVSRVATAYLHVRARPDWARVKACAEPDCRHAFVDRSRNGSRRWCDMSECGNRAKHRTWRARRVAASSTDSSRVATSDG